MVMDAGAETRLKVGLAFNRKSRSFRGFVFTTARIWVTVIRQYILKPPGRWPSIYTISFAVQVFQAHGYLWVIRSAVLTFRMYASMYPKEVVGMVLVDSAHEEQFARMEALIPDEIKRQFPPNALVPTSNEKLDLKESTEQSRKANWHANIPLIVLMAADARPNPQGPLAFLAEKWEQIRQELQQDLVHRSAMGKQIVATRSGHFIHHDEPALVVSAIQEVIQATRKQK